MIEEDTAKMVSAHRRGEETYWKLLMEAYEAESTYQMVVVKDRRRITNRMVQERRRTRDALAAFLQGETNGHV